MSLIALAEAIDGLVEAHQAYVVESEFAATVSSLSAHDASRLQALCVHLGWHAELFDGAGELWSSTDAPDPGFGLFRLTVQKPVPPSGALQLLSNHAFAQWLETGHVARHWHIARFVGSVAAGGRVIQSWEGGQEPAVLPPTKSPRALVKEFGNVRRVPEDVREWLTVEFDDEHFSHRATQVWVRAASAALISCLPDEIDSDTGAYKFRGPPRLTLPAFNRAVGALDLATFNTLLKATRWVFEHEREAEMRHILLAAELARSAAAAESTPAFLRQHLAHAWESAQIAYQMALAETGRETLKVLSDLRRAVTDEAAKLSDISRQLTASVAAAVATGIGLIAARVAANAPGWLIAAVMLVVAVYVAVVIFSGLQFMQLQRQLRIDWQHRLYRFLPDAEYKRMVADPTAKAERSFVCTAWLGGAVVSVLTAACFWVVLSSSPSEAVNSTPDRAPAPKAQPPGPGPGPGHNTPPAIAPPTSAKPTAAPVTDKPVAEDQRPSGK